MTPDVPMLEGLEPERIVRLEEDAVVLLDQRRLPEEEVELRCTSATAVADAIAAMAIRGAPAIGIAAAEGHPALVMDMSFANQALASEWVIANAATLERRVYDVPKEIDDEIARLKLATMGITIDQLTEEQARYLASWDEGT